MVRPDHNTEGRENNAAQPLGEREGLVSSQQAKATGEAERRSAGPDGPKAEAVGRTFKREPKA
ncbi:MAG: hypothetical protein JSS35_00235 [Proteobacteria bacterium]|nr:hypothetical protein [Pseudomonadota bacterium]